MVTYDFIMLFVFACLTLYGYTKGMAWQAAYLGSLILSYFIAVKFAGQLAPMFGDKAPANKFFAMLAIYAGTSLVIWILFRFVRGAIDRVKMQGFDHQMGAVIGAARGLLWCMGITFFALTLGFVPESFKQQIIGSKSGRTIAKILNNADAVVPEELHGVIGPYVVDFENKLNGQPGQQIQTPNLWQQPQGYPQQPYQAPQAPAYPQPQYPQQQQPGAGFGWPAQTQSAPTGTPAQPATWPGGQPPQQAAQPPGSPAAQLGWPQAP